jgi:hypothetical protein
VAKAPSDSVAVRQQRHQFDFIHFTTPPRFQMSVRFGEINSGWGGEAKTILPPASYWASRLVVNVRSFHTGSCKSEAK